MSKLVTRRCLECGAAFAKYPSQLALADTQHCSRECWARSRRDGGKRLTAECRGCGAEFEHYSSSPRIYCSRQCSAKANATNLKAHYRPLASRPTRCDQCDGALPEPVSARRRFCSRRCFGEWLRNPINNDLARRDFVRGRKLITRVTVECAICERPFEVKRSSAKRRVCCSIPCRARLQEGRLAGERNGNWRGGYQPYYGPSWRPAQRAVRQRDRVCIDCGISPADIGKALDVHHIRLFREFGAERHAEANDPSNLVALCFGCHSRRPEHR